jgi:hypothetical protein
MVLGLSIVSEAARNRDLIPIGLQINIQNNETQNF